MLDGNTMARLDGRESAGWEQVGEADGWERAGLEYEGEAGRAEEYWSGTRWRGWKGERMLELNTVTRLEGRESAGL